MQINCIKPRLKWRAINFGMESFTSLLSNEQELQNEVNRKQSILSPLQSEIDVLKEYLTQNKGKTQKYSPLSKEIKILLYEIESIIDRIEFIKQSWLWKILKRIGLYSKEIALIVNFRKGNEILFATVFPDMKIPTSLVHFEEIKDELEKIFVKIKDITIKEKHYNKLKHKADELQKEKIKSENKLSNVKRKIEDLSILSNRHFNILHESKLKFKEELTSNIEQTRQLTEKQWEFILSNSRNICIIAGAGSGKSTTLIYRALFLHKHIGVSLKELTIFTFTKKTRADLHEKFKKVFLRFGITVNDDQIKNIVHTFHSKAYQIACNHYRDKPLFFEFLKDHNYTQTEFSTDDAILPNLSLHQIEISKKVYEKLWNHNEKFRQVCGKLFLNSFMDVKGMIDDYKDEAYNIASEGDSLLLQQTLELAKEYIQPSVKVTDGGVQFNIEHNVKKIKFYSHHKINLQVENDNINAYIHYLPYSYTPDVKLKSSITIKKKIIAAHCSEPHIFITNKDEYNIWYKHLPLFLGCNNSRGNKEFPPIFDISLKGELGKQSIYETFYAQGTFIEYIGLDVVETCRKIIRDYTDKPDKLDKNSLLFTEVLQIYWIEFQKVLKGKNIFRFHDIFSLLRKTENIEKPDDYLKSMNHIMIDEFQDINPEIAEAIKSIMRYNKQKETTGSICSIGDDYQAIYGWRGSSPIYFIEYNDRFPSRNIHKIKMEHNFRSLQKIIDTAENIVKDSEYKLIKHGKQGRNIDPIEGTCIEIISIDKDSEQNLVKNYLNKYKGGNLNIFIMARTNDKLKSYKKYIKSNVTVLTYHSSKGLEADVCILTENCFYYPQFLFRDVCYKLAGYGQSYSNMQKDEAKRLAYVALTRAKKKIVLLIETDNKREGALDKLFI